MEDYPLLNLIWTMIVFSILVMWVFVVISVFMDNFRRNDHGGWAKALWTIFLVFLPVLGVLAYTIVRPRETEQDRELREAAIAAQRRLSGGSAADDLHKAKGLLDAGVISQAEFDKLKSDVLA
ncbi:MAG: SHOCT domain-containing protein [Thermoleophilia bacterium]|nr:SHOCT domain-containing protein [Thermoleophilia bacterium]